MKMQLRHTYNDIISLENLIGAWQEFIVGKRSKNDVRQFERNLMDNIVELHTDLVNRTYHHGGYESFYVNDPKRRHIHKASVRDRLLHHAIYRILCPFFDRTFIADSYSCRNDKGVHKALSRFKKFSLQVGQNNSRTCWVLKCDIRKFFASIDQETLMTILRMYIPDLDSIALLENIVGSFHTENTPGIGLPLGNLTSQLLANVYMSPFDHWVKHGLKAKQYIRYADDFVFLSHDKTWLEKIAPQIETFLQSSLLLSLHPDKVFLKTLTSGVDFLGWVHFSDHRLIRGKTKQRMFMKIKESATEERLQSYLGLLNHGNSVRLRQQALGEYWLWQ